MASQARYLILTISMSSAIMACFLNWKLSLSGCIVSAILVTTIIEFLLDIKERYENHKIFDKGNLPSLANKNPYTGNIVELFLKNNVCEQMLNYHRQFGGTIGFFFGPVPWVATTDLDLVQKVFVTDADKHINTPSMRLPMIPMINDSIMQLRNEQWRNTRRSLNPSFSHKQIKADNVTKEVEDSCARLLDCIAGHPEEADGAQTVDVLQNFAAFSIDIIIKLILDRRDGFIKMKPNEKDELLQVVKLNVKSLVNPFVWISVIFDWARRPLGYLSKFTLFGRTSRHLCSVFEQSLELRRQKILESRANRDNKLQLDGTQMIDTLLSWANDNKMKDINISAQLWFLLVAGFETTSNTLTVLFWLLARNQDAQEKLRQAILLEGEEAAYMVWCIDEALRLYPAAPATGRTLNEDLILTGGRKLFKGTNLSVNIYAIHHSKDYWGPDVEEFKPERFSKPLGHKYQFFAFSGGPRGCMGKHLAYKQMKAIVSKILLTYRIEPCPATPTKLKWTAPNLIDIIIEGPIKLKFIELNRGINCRE